MKALATEYSLSDLCAAFEVSRSGYYAWASRAPGPRAQANALLTVQIHEVYRQHRENYGSPRVTGQLRQQGHRCNRKRVARLMREQGLRGRQQKRFRVVTTDSNHDHPIAPNRLKGLKISAPNQVWVADITYVPTAEGWLYVAGVLDLYSRKLVGWAMEAHLETRLTLDALQMALRQRRPEAGLISPLRSRSTICQRHLSAAPRGAQPSGQHEPQSLLLRQCGHGIILEQLEERTGSPPCI